MKMKKTVKRARIQSAVYGFIIPMMSIPKLYRQLEAAVIAGASDENLKTIVAQFPGVEASNR